MLRLHEYVDKHIGKIAFASITTAITLTSCTSCKAIKEAYQWQPKTEEESNQVYQIQRQHRDMNFSDVQRQLDYQRSLTK